MEPARGQLSPWAPGAEPPAQQPWALSTCPCAQTLGLYVSVRGFHTPLPTEGQQPLPALLWQPSKCHKHLSKLFFSQCNQEMQCVSGCCAKLCDRVDRQHMSQSLNSWHLCKTLPLKWLHPQDQLGPFCRLVLSGLLMGSCRQEPGKAPWTELSSGSFRRSLQMAVLNIITSVLPS